ncbi:probable methyltransferase-like protein 25 [Spea bombifrons]|uniref:probable methyltransferase-like protein 25 n=1 Tax=Spea bombifrons TaxID=233779 RepID=UPI00234BF2CA|nr:probable methyltransferase-like protein 25 [Spea bombifrons]
MSAQLPPVTTDQVKVAITKLVQFLQRTRQISEAHTVDFYTEDVWNNLVAIPPATVLSTFHEQSKTSSQTHGGVPDLSSIFCHTTQRLVNFKAFVKAAQYHSLADLGICTPVDELLEALSVNQALRPNKEMKADTFMNDKKSHEVLMMSKLVDGIASVCGVKQVIDLGAGKGYLSSYLSMQYDLKVYGIDSSHTTTDGANKRNRKLKKYWQAYKANARTSSKAQESNQTKASVLPRNMCVEVNTNRDLSRYENSAFQLEELSICDSAIMDKSNSNTNSLSLERSKEDYETNNVSLGMDVSRENTLSFLDILPPDAVELSSVSQGASRVLSEQEKEQRKIENIKAKKRNESTVYSPLTSYVTADTELRDIIKDFKEAIMVGLHTCGDLAPNTLRIYTTKPEIKAVCSVGCCYHLMSEEFDSPEKANTVKTWGFPMSRYVKESCCCIGRNSRMSACLALDRVAVGQGLPVESLFYRAVLQVMCRDIYAITQRDWQKLQGVSSGDLKDNMREKRVGKIYAKSTCFTDYVRKSLQKLGQDHSKLSDKQITDYYEKFLPRKIELEAFNMLKVFLAPSVEALILLDRLCYLKEQDNIGWSGLVKLFDPVKSPRCYAVVSLKQT